MKNHLLRYLSFLLFLSSTLSFGAIWDNVKTLDTKQELIDLARHPASSDYCGGTFLLESECKEIRDLYVSVNCYDQEYSDWTKREGYVVNCVGRGPKVLAVCKCGCFTEDARILSFEKGNESNESWRTIKSLYENQEKYGVLRVSSDSESLSDFTMDRSYDNYFLKGEKQTKDFVELLMSNGNTLKITGDHGLLLSNGMMIRAGDVQPSDSLVGVNGELVTIVSINRTVETRDIYNVSTDAGPDTLSGHLIFAEGIVIGDAEYQNSLEDFIGEAVIRGLEE